MSCPETGCLKILILLINLNNLGKQKSKARLNLKILADFVQMCR